MNSSPPLHNSRRRGKKIELLAPAGNFEKLEIAVHYGADAVYLAGKAFSLRSFAENFTLDQIREAVGFAHRNNVKVYVACNIYPRNRELMGIAEYLEDLAAIGPDAVIVADPGVLAAAGKRAPSIPVHLSTQANTTNCGAARFWEELGVRRINVARELSLKEIKEIAEGCSLEIEAFVHGAMCISYSGRCLLSSFLADRDSNLGRCTQACRWKYFLVEEFRPGKFMPLAEDDRGSYIFNSKDLCMIEHLPAMIESGVIALKIEGRMKGINYLASTVKVYREAIDSYLKNPSGFRVKEEWVEELGSIAHRGYCTGAYLGCPGQESVEYDIKNNGGKTFVGKIVAESGPRGAGIDVRNKIFKGDAVEVLTQKGPARRDEIIGLFDTGGRALDFARPGDRVLAVLRRSYTANDLVRKTDRG